MVSYNPRSNYVTRFGEDTVKCSIRCTGKSGVIYDSLNPNALTKIKDLETGNLHQPFDPFSQRHFKQQDSLVVRAVA